MFTKLVLPDIQELIEKKYFKSVKNIFLQLPPQDISDLINKLDENFTELVFRLVPKDKTADVFSELEPSVQEYILKHFVDSEIKSLLSELDPDDRTELFEDMPGIFTQKLISYLSPEDRKEALELLGFPEDSVGRLMTPDYVAVKSDWTVAKALEHIKRFGRDAETINMIYVVDDKWKLLDDIPIRRFILAESNKKVEEIMDYSVIFINAYEDQEEAYKLIKKYNLTVLPVVDKEGILLGIITVDDIIDVNEEEVTEDFQKASAIAPTEESYNTTSAMLLYRKRIGWLLILLVTDFFSSSIIAHYESAIKAVIALAFFIPVLIDSGGNIAAQSSTLIIRSLATGELSIRNWFNVVKKELLIGLMIGISLGLILYIRGFFWRGGPTIGMVVGLSMVAITIWSNLLGSLLPILLTKLKLDPAVISSPLLTTVVDSTGLLIYFTLAGLVFHLS